MQSFLIALFLAAAVRGGEAARCTLEDIWAPK